MLHRFAYLLPLLALAGVFIYAPEAIVHRDYVEWLLLVGGGLAVVAATHAMVRYFGKDIEFLSGYVVTVKHYRPWTERQVYYVTVSDGKGKSRQEMRVRYINHPDQWEWVLNNGHVTSISHSTYDELVARWGGDTTYFPTNHSNCVSGGGGELANWDEVIDHVETETYESRYTNPLDHSNSIFRYTEISEQEAKERGLYDYPKVQNGKQYPIVGLGIATAGDQRAFQLLNAMHGNEHQVHFFVLLYDAAKGLTIGEDQRAYWHGGNKNEFTICLGIEKKEDTGENILKWCNAFSWMDEPVLELALEGWARECQDKPLDLQSFCHWLEEHLGLWKRKEWKDFAYLSNPMRTWQLVTLYGVAAAACAAIVYYLLSY